MTLTPTPAPTPGATWASVQVGYKPLVQVDVKTIVARWCDSIATLDIGWDDLRALEVKCGRVPVQRDILIRKSGLVEFARLGVVPLDAPYDRTMVRINLVGPGGPADAQQALAFAVTLNFLKTIYPTAAVDNTTGL